MHPGDGIDPDEPTITIVLGRVPRRRGIPVPTGHPIILGGQVHRPLVRRAFPHLRRLDPASLAPGCDESSGLPAGHPGDVPELRDRPPPLCRIAVLDARVEEPHAGIPQRGAMARVQGHGVGERLHPGANAANHIRPTGRPGGRYGRGDHGGGRHRWLCPHGDDASRVEEDPDAGNRIGPIVKSRAERRRQRLHVVRREWLIIRAEGFFERIQGGAHGIPFILGFQGGRFKPLSQRIAVTFLVRFRVESAWESQRACGRHHPVHRNLPLCGKRRRVRRIRPRVRRAWCTPGWRGEIRRVIGQCRREAMGRLGTIPCRFHGLYFPPLVFRCEVRDTSGEQDEIITGPKHGVQFTHRRPRWAMTPSIVGQSVRYVSPSDESPPGEPLTEDDSR